MFNKNIISACADPLPFSLLFLPESKSITHEISLNKVDCIISVDCSSKDQMKFPITKKDIPLINIDHHTSNNKFGSTNIVVTNAASTSEILYQLFEYLKTPISPQIATYLLSGLYCDTGSFMHSNTSAEVYKIASKLMNAGASLTQIVKNMFKTHTIEQLKLWGKVLNNARLNKKGTLVSKITASELKETNASPRDLTGIINYLNSVPNVNMSILLSEDLHGNVQGSVRSAKDGINAAEVCEQLGGGGHEKAAGFTIPGKIVSEEIWRIES
jgi:phosphoesterase RecJ-like protein